MRGFRRSAIIALTVAMPMLASCTASDPPLEPREALRQAAVSIDRILEEDLGAETSGSIPARHPAGGSDTISFWYYSHPLIAPAFAKGPRTTSIEITGSKATIHAQFIGDWPYAVQKLTIALAADELPDVAMVKRGLVARLYKAGRILPLDSILPESFTDDLPRNIRDANTCDGRLVSLPADGSCSVMLYNTALVPNPPEDWAELVELATALKTTHSRSGRGESDTATIVYPVGYMPFLESFWSAGGEVVREGTCGLSSDEAVRALEFLVSLGVDGLATWDCLSNEARALDKFRRGELALTVASSFATSTLTNAPFDVGVAPVPGETGPISSWSNDALVVFARGSGAGAAELAAFFDALTASPPMIAQMSRIGSVPIRESIRMKVEVSDGLALAVGVARGTPLTTSWNAVEVELNRHLNRALRWAAEQPAR